MGNTKKCLRCKIEKDISKFSKDKYKKDGLESYCKLCEKERQKSYRENNKEKVRETKKKYKRKSTENGTCVKCAKPKLEKSKYCLYHYVRNILGNGCYSELTQDERDYYTEVLIDKLEEQNYKCYATGLDLITGENCNLDHIKPKKYYPELTLDLENLAWCDQLFNSIKNSHTLEDAMERWNRYCEQIIEGYKYKHDTII